MKRISVSIGQNQPHYLIVTIMELILAKVSSLNQPSVPEGIPRTLTELVEQTPVTSPLPTPLVTYLKKLLAELRNPPSTAGSLLLPSSDT